MSQVDSLHMFATFFWFTMFSIFIYFVVTYSMFNMVFISLQVKRLFSVEYHHSLMRRLFFKKGDASRYKRSSSCSDLLFDIYQKLYFYSFGRQMMLDIIKKHWKY